LYRETGCCGFFQPSFTLANIYKVTADGLPMLGDEFFTNPLKTDQGISSDKVTLLTLQLH